MKHITATILTLAALGGSAATNYIVPWYANPVATNVAYNALQVNDPTDATIAAKITTAWATVKSVP